MKKLEAIQIRKLMTSYGGVGSIIETKDNGSLLIEPFNTWRCYQYTEHIPIINNPRLLSNINRPLPDDNNIHRLLTIPEDVNLERIVHTATAAQIRKTIKSSYFPGWFFCTNPKCRRLHKYDDWERLWKTHFNNDNSFRRYYPACPFCSTRIQNNRFRRKYLEQIRFLMVSADTGKISDIPFDRIWEQQHDSKIFHLSDCPVQDDLFYTSSGNSDGLQSIYIRKGNLNGAERIPMSAIESKYIVYPKEPRRGAYKLALRNQNNIYYPHIVKSIYIPLDNEDLTNEVISLHCQNYTEAQILNQLSNRYTNLSLQNVQNIIADSEVDLKIQEFHYIINENNYNRRGINKKNDFVAKRYENLSVGSIQRIYAISRLKETSVIPYYSRIGTPDQQIDWLDLNNPQNQQEVQITPKTISTSTNPNTDFLPAVEAYGEGLFFELNTDNIDEPDKNVYVHSLCHMIMKELEFQCGYSLSSLKEKIYNENGKFAFLIYTIGGADGSYGGLVSLLPQQFDCLHTPENPIRLINIIENAIERAHYCPNDPICRKEGGHCFACLDIPEISCEMWNKDLNRNVVIKYHPLVNTQTAPVQVSHAKTEPAQVTPAEKLKPKALDSLY